MHPALLHHFRSAKETLDNLSKEQKYGILATGGLVSVRPIDHSSLYMNTRIHPSYTVCAISIVATSLYRRRKKREQWQKEQAPILATYWSDTYQEAREKFRASCQQIANCKTHSLRVDPMEDLSIDLCYIPSNTASSSSKARHLVIHISGTHGVEGYAGSAIQSRLLSEIATANKRGQPRDCDILFVHALNAYGMCHGRRFNRYNVDLNRNTILSKQRWKELKSRDPNMNGYDSAWSVINPDCAPTYPWTDLWLWCKMFVMLLKFGRATAGRAVVNGQYHKATGIFYGGFQLQNEQKKLLHFVVHECQTEWNVDLMASLKESGSKLTVLDVHTGIGPKGVDLLLASNPEQIKKTIEIDGFPKEYFEIKQRLERYTDKSSQLNQVYGGSVGGVRDALVRVFQQQTLDVDEEMDSSQRLDCVAITEEFGTVPAMKVIHALVLENASYHLQGNDTESEQVLSFRQNRLRDVFYLRDDVEWKYDVLRRGVALFHCLCER